MERGCDMEWQPIETAPRDGTAIRLAQFHPLSDPKGKPEKSCIGAYVKTQGMRNYQFKKRIVRNGVARYYFLYGWYLSHWMPLPAPPEVK